MVKENNGSFVAAIVASRAADFEYTVTVETSDDTAVGKQNGSCSAHAYIYYDMCRGMQKSVQSYVHSKLYNYKLFGYIIMQHHSACINSWEQN